MLGDLLDYLIGLDTPDGAEVPDPITGETVVRIRTEESPAALQRLTRPGYAVSRR